ncbi:MAG: ATP-dependent helicase [Caulobacteraceae bacterium]|nr:ATP-dependent helicase [Caulobacteraceae bacterium]
MPQCLRAIGGAGTGKTSLMKQTAEKALARPEMGGNPFSLGYSSLTRAARLEAAMRCGTAWGVPPEELMQHGWFRTAHSVCYRQLGVSRGEMIAGGKEDEKWVSEAVDSDVAFAMDDDEDGGIAVYQGDPVAAAALNYWSLARNVCLPLRDIVEADQDPEAPAASDVIRRITMYEQAKRLDGRFDFTDLLSRFVGIRFDPEDGPVEVAPEGSVPDEVVGWIFDEAQDSSRLLDLACRRLVTGDACRWAWLVGDPYQVLFSWAGAAAEHFMGWDVTKQHIMPKSFRCPKPIMQLGERCLQRLPDYWDRGIAPADHDGEVVESENFEDDLSDLRPDEDTLVIARANRNVSKIRAILEDIGVPFRYVKQRREGVGCKELGMAGLWRLQHGEGISGEAWGRITEILPSKTTDGTEWLTRGSKSAWKKGLSERYDRVYPEDLPALGASPQLCEAVASGKWSGLPDGGTKWVRAAKKWGVEAVSEPKIRIGTIHSSKGMEASKVIVLSSVSQRTRVAEEDDEKKFAEERRIEYVACTRAKHKLVVAHDPRAKYRMELPL